MCFKKDEYMGIEVIRDEMADLVDPSTEPELVADGFQFTEGPIWDPKKGCLLFSDIPADTIFKWTPDEGAVPYRQPSHHSNGLTLDGQGRLLSCEHSGRRVSIEEGGEVKTLVDSYQGKKLNSPNDLVVCQNGDIIFTDPPYGLSNRHGVDAEQELDFLGVYRLPHGESEPILLIDDFERPNGLALTPDEKTLYVDDTARGQIRVFDVQEDGSLANGSVLAELKGDEPGAPDGLKLDLNGNNYCTGPGAVWVHNSQGDLLGKIKLPLSAANLNWGGEDRKTLYFTARTDVYRIQCKVGG
jgi:sugar lactone lactonase YvrE